MDTIFPLCHTTNLGYPTGVNKSAFSSVSGLAMAIEEIRCKFCASEQLQRFTAEMAVHFPGLKNIDKPHVYVSAELVVCLNCGTAQFAVPEAQLGQLAKGAASAAANAA